MNCNLDFLKKNNIPYSWNTFFVGVKLNILNNTAIVDYAVQYLLDHPKETNQFIAELVCLQETTSSVDALLEHLLTPSIKSFEPGTYEWAIEERKLRFCLLSDLHENIVDKYILLEKIAELYADFDYPPDMEEFVHYMPAKNYDPSLHSKEENIQRLLTLFSRFLDKEKMILKIEEFQSPY